MSVALQVNGCRVSATRLGADYWMWWTVFHRNSGRITSVKETLGGAVENVACDDKDHAQWLMDTFIANGIHKSALKIVTVAEQS